MSDGDGTPASAVGGQGSLRGLREQVLQGGGYMAARQVASIGIGLGGVILLTRLIGPTNYGLAVGATGVLAFFDRIGRFGVDAYLKRRKEVPDEVYHQAFLLMLCIGLGIVSAGLLATSLFSGWFGDSRFIPPLQALLPSLLLSFACIPAMAQVERDMNYRALAKWQLAEHLASYIVALPLALLGWGVWAPITGIWASKCLVVVRSYSLTRYRPRVVWSRPLLQEMVRYGAGYSASSWMYQLRGLINPLVVGRYLGPEAVAFVSLAIRFVEMLTFPKALSWNLAMVAFGKVQDDLVRLRRGVEEAMPLQILAIGPVLGGFALVAPVLLPRLFGREWDAVLKVFPFIALSYLVNAVFNMHSSALYVVQKNRSVALFNAAHVLLFAGASLLLVPRVGILGYGLGEVVALLSYLVIHQQVVGQLFPVTYSRTWPWLLASIPPLFTVFLPFPWAVLLWFPALVVVVWPERRRQIREYLGYAGWRPA